MMKQQRKPAYSLDPERFLDRDERRQLLKTCRERAELDLLHGRTTWPVRYMLIDLALYSGLRVAEIASLKLHDLLLTISQPCIVVRHGKGDRKRKVYLDTGLVKHLKQFIQYKERTLRESVDDSAPLFSGRTGHCPTITLMKSFKQAVVKAGLRRELSIHAARHTYATFLLHDTKNLRYVQRQLGHSNISMTALYSGILPEENGVLANKIVRDEP